MAQLPEVLAPRSDERGLATSDRARLAADVAQSWALFSAMLDDADLDAPTRAKGLTVRELVIPLGAWDDNRPLAQLLDEARRGVVGDHDQGALVDAVREAHRHESDDAVCAAVARQGEAMEYWLYGDDDSLAEAPVASMLGTLPLITFLHAATYPLATTALDVASTGVEVPEQLLDNGLLGLVDTIGALAARQGLTASIAGITPTTLVGAGATGGAWRTALIDPAGLALPGDVGPSVEGSTRLLLEVTAGRADVPGAVRRKEIAVHDLNGLMALAPIVEQVPGIPGRAALVGAIRATTAVTSVLRMLPFGRRQG
ncbi:MAG: hypothetical protein U0S36_12970 [Candidatus Nanopelagicales bacterium]